MQICPSSPTPQKSQQDAAFNTFNLLDEKKKGSQCSLLMAATATLLEIHFVTKLSARELNLKTAAA